MRNKFCFHFTLEKHFSSAYYRRLKLLWRLAGVNHPLIITVDAVTLSFPVLG